MAKPNRNLRLVQSEETPAVKELEAIEAEILRGISLLQVLTRAVADMGEAELEVSLQIAAKHLDDAHNRMDDALIRLRREQQA